MNISIKLTRENSPIVVGEMLMNSLCPDGSRFGYDTCSSKVLEETRTLLLTSQVLGILGVDYRERGIVKTYRHKEFPLLVYTFCEGDTTVLFEFEGSFLINTDAKKDYTWEWVDG